MRFDFATPASRRRPIKDWSQRGYFDRAFLEVRFL
jgi:hypothetical protein